MRLFFATDIHGSEICWKKFLNCGEHYEADVVILAPRDIHEPLAESGNGRNGGKDSQAGKFFFQILGHFLDQEVAERHAAKTLLTVGDRVKHGAIGGFRIEDGSIGIE